MSEAEKLLEVKMDILIKDFQRFRDMQEEMNKSSRLESKVQQQILTTQKWHTVIGSSMVLTFAAHVLRGGF